MIEVESGVVAEDVVGGREAELAGGEVNGLGRSLEFGERADGSFVEFDEEAGGPGERGGKGVGSAELFVAETGIEAEAGEDFLKRGGVGDVEFGFFANFVTAIGEGGGIEGGDGALESKNPARRGVAGEGSFGADAEELAMILETRVGSVEEDVGFVEAGDANFGAEESERVLKGEGIGEAELDFDFVGHGERVADGRAGNVNTGERVTRRR